MKLKHFKPMLIPSILFLSGLITSVVTMNKPTGLVVGADVELKSLTLNKSNAYNGSGKNYVTTSTTQYIVEFAYENASTYEYGHVTLFENGTLKNVGQLKSLANVTVKYSGSGKLQAQTAFGGNNYSNLFDIESERTFNFASNPYYVNFKAINGSVNIDSIRYEFSCLDNKEAEGHDGDAKYKLVKNVNDIQDGDIVYIVGGSSELASLSVTNKTNKPWNVIGDVVSPKEGIIESGGTEWKVSLKGSNFVFNSSNKDLYGYVSENGSRINVGDKYTLLSEEVDIVKEFNATNEFIYTIDDSSSGRGSLKNASSDTYLVCISENNPIIFKGLSTKEWNSSSDYPIYLYRKVSEKTWNIPKDPVGFSATDIFKDKYNSKTCYYFDNGLTVTANYSDGSIRNLDRDEYTYKVSTDMEGKNVIDKTEPFGKAGKYYVTVNYNNLIPSILELNVASSLEKIEASMTKTTYVTSDKVELVNNLETEIIYDDGTSYTVKYVDFAEKGINVTLSDPNGIRRDIDDIFAIPGKWSLIVEYQSLEDTIELTVNAVAVVDISLNITEYTLCEGETVTLTVSFNPTNATDQTVTWSSSDSSIASVDSYGLVNALTIGNATITATSNDGGKTATCEIEVKKSSTIYATLIPCQNVATTKLIDYSTAVFNTTVINVTSVSGERVYGTGQAGSYRFSTTSYAGKMTINFESVLIKQVTLSIKQYDSNAKVKIYTNTHTNEEIVTINKSGLNDYVFDQFKTDKTDSTSLTIQGSSGKRFYLCGITIGITPKDPIYPTSISLSQTSATTYIGESFKLEAKYSPSDANQIKTTWESTNELVATVYEGTVSGISAGVTTITATTKNEAGEDLTSSCVVSVQPVAVTGVSLNFNELKIEIGKTQSLVATVLPNNATNKNVTWKSLNESVATVNNGQIAGISLGTTTIMVTTEDGAKTDICEVEIIEQQPGFVHIDSNELTATSDDYEPTFAPTEGEAKVLIVPLTLQDSTKGSWDTTNLNNLNEYFFGNGQISFKNYYGGVSHKKVNFSGMVATPFSVTYTTSQLNNNMTYIFNTFDSAVASIKANNPGVDWSEYDLNNDGYFDSIHFLTNYNATSWGANLWPHKYNTGRSAGTPESPTVDTYSLSALYVQSQKMSDSITQIHEQGHIFGMDDYYNYTSGSSADYIGSADMQDYNMFEWNSFSKLSAGWASPYVVDGTSDNFEITMNSAAQSEDCLIIPANYDTWNGSAFDEYFVVELFTNSGINSAFWSEWNSYYGTLPSSGFGVRIYHVDARVCKSSGGAQVNPEDWNPSSYYYIQGCNNSSTASSYVAYNPSWSNFALLQLVQATGTNTHTSGANMNKNDLFQKGDVFNWDLANNFLRKDGSTVTTMDDGETFPWTITFTEMSKTSVTMRITK